MMKDRNYPKISIITIVYNDVSNIRETIESVLEQTYKNIEYIVIDGGSTDGTVEIINKFVDKIDFWVSESDGGIYPAMNKGLKFATGDVINMMNSGDKYNKKEVVGKVAEFFREKEELSFVLGKSKFVNLDGTDALLGKEEMLTDLEIGRFTSISHQAFFYKKSLHEDFDLYDLKYKICADGHFMYKVYQSSKHVGKLVDEVFAITRQSGISSSSASILEHKRLYDEVFGRSLLNELLYVKYLLRKSSLGRLIYNQYLTLKRKFFKGE